MNSSQGCYVQLVHAPAVSVRATTHDMIS